MTVQKRLFIGTSPTKREDRALLLGQGRFADDIRLTDPLYVAFARSPVSSARLTALDTSAAQRVEGVFAVHTGQDVTDLGNLAVNAVLPLHHHPPFPTLADGSLHAVGQPFAAVLAGCPMQALDGVDAISAEFDETEPKVRTVASQSWRTETPDWEAAAHVVSCEIRHPRLAPSPMEPRSIAIAYDTESDRVTIWHSTQTPHRSRSELASILGIDPTRLRVIAQHVGGAFGMKGSLYPEEVFAVWASLHHKRDVKWTATRSEEFLSATHGRGVVSEGRLAVDSDGRFLGLEARITAPIGPWLPNSGLITAWNAARILPGGYDVAALDLKTKAQTQPGGPMGIYRGAGRPEANCLMERLVDKAARMTGLDPVEIRQRNLLPSSALPHKTATGDVLDSGDYSRALSVLCQKVDYPALRERQARRRAAGELVGIGLSFYLEPSGSGWESATVTLYPNGKATVASGSSSQGHGRQTALAQIAAEALALPLDAVEVTMADTGETPAGIGALASRSTAIGGSAVWQACMTLKYRQASGAELPLTETVRYENKGQAWGYGAYLVVISICRETGQPLIEQVTCVDDAGRIVNPRLVAGQVLGGFAQGWGEAMQEKVVYDDDGQLLTGSFMDYAIPRAADIPPLEINTFETPSPMNLLGAKGVGEAGTIGAPPAILNAAVDALSPLGVTDLSMPLTSNSLWQAIQDAEQGTQ